MIVAEYSTPARSQRSMKASASAGSGFFPVSGSLAGKGKEANRGRAGRLLIENQNGLAVVVRATHATGTAEREAALVLFDRQPGSRHRVTLGSDRAYDTQDFVQACRNRQVTPHVRQNTTARRSAIDRRTTRHPGDAISQRINGNGEASTTARGGPHSVDRGWSGSRESISNPYVPGSCMALDESRRTG